MVVELARDVYLHVQDNKKIITCEKLRELLKNYWEELKERYL